MKSARRWVRKEHAKQMMPQSTHTALISSLNKVRDAGTADTRRPRMCTRDAWASAASNHAAGARRLATLIEAFTRARGSAGPLRSGSRCSALASSPHTLAHAPPTPITAPTLVPTSPSTHTPSHPAIPSLAFFATVSRNAPWAAPARDDPWPRPPTGRAPFHARQVTLSR